MSRCVNKVILVGYTGEDPERRKTKSGAEFVHTSLATTKSWKDRSTGERREKTTWHDINIWPEHVQNFTMQYVRKGKHLYIEGTINTFTYDDEAGIKRRHYEITVDHGGVVTMLSKSDGGGRRDPEEPEYMSVSEPAGETPPGMDDEIPF